MNAIYIILVEQGEITEERFPVKKAFISIDFWSV